MIISFAETVDAKLAKKNGKKITPDSEVFVLNFRTDKVV